MKETFRKLKEICTTTPILASAEFAKPFKLLTDACMLELVAIQYQSQDGVDHVIPYASRSFSKTEHKYLAHKLEFLALKWAVMEQSMITCMAIILLYIQIIIPSHMS